MIIGSSAANPIPGLLPAPLHQAAQGLSRAGLSTLRTDGSSGPGDATAGPSGSFGDVLRAAVQNGERARGDDARDVRPSPTLDGAGAATGSGSMIFRDLAGRRSPEELLRRSAEELVSMAFLKPMFSMLRSDPLKSDLFGQSKAEKTFAPMLDDEFARRIVSSAQWPIVDAVVRRLQVTDGGPSGGAPTRNE